MPDQPQPQPPTEPEPRPAPPAAPADLPTGDPGLRTLRVATALAGVGLIGYSVYGLLDDSYITDPADVLWWAVGGLAIHDGLWLPLVCLAGAVFVRGAAARAGLIVAAALTSVALPSVLRAGENHGNPSVLALPYLRNWLLALAVVAVASTGWALLHRHRRRR